ncbi:MAG: hypothetical protein WAZ18_05290 [Alphaproteobacteria bacterium]
MAVTVSREAYFKIMDLIKYMRTEMRDVPGPISDADQRSLSIGTRLLECLDKNLKSGSCERDLMGMVYQVQDCFHPIAGGLFQDGLMSRVINIREAFGYINYYKEDVGRFDRDVMPVTLALDALDQVETFLGELSTTEKYSPGRNMTVAEAGKLRSKLNALLDKLNQPEFEPTYKGEFKFEFECKERD